MRKRRPFVDVQGNDLAFEGGIPQPGEWNLHLLLIFYYNCKICGFNPA